METEIILDVIISFHLGKLATGTWRSSEGVDFHWNDVGVNRSQDESRGEVRMGVGEGSGWE